MRSNNTIKRFLKKSNNSLIPENGISGTKYESGEKVLLDGDRNVTVVSQRPLKTFTYVSNGLNSFEVQTDRLTKIND